MIRLKSVAPQYKLYVDLDGVLTDFDRQFYELTGTLPTDFKTIHGPKTDDAKWTKVEKDGGLYFWSHMYWMPDGRKLWDYIKGKNVEILSAPSRHVTNSELGKKLWCKRFLGKDIPLNLEYAQNKHKFAGPHNILIDDMEENVNDWRNKGGIAILHKSADDTISKLKELGI